MTYTYLGDNMEEYLTSLMGQFGYFGMFLGMVLEAVIIIIPSELILATAGILAGRGIFSFPMAFLVGLMGSVFCAVVLYGIGYFGGRPPIVRTLISLPMGISKVPFSKFCFYTTLGSIPWTFAFVYVGYALGNNWVILNEMVAKLKGPIKVLLFTLLIYYLYKKVRKKS